MVGQLSVGSIAVRRLRRRRLQHIVESDRLTDPAGDVTGDSCQHPGSAPWWGWANSMFMLGFELELFEPLFPLVGVIVAIQF